MKLTKYNSRARAEEGVFMPLCDPYSPYAPIEAEEGKEAPGFMVRGAASHTAQQALGALASKHAAEKAVAKAAAAAEDGKADTPVVTAPLEALHKTQIESAMTYIIRAVNIEDDKGVPVDARPDALRALLDMTFPELGYLPSEDESAKPQMGVVNKTFAYQVTEWAEDGAHFLAPKENDSASPPNSSAS